MTGETRTRTTRVVAVIFGRMDEETLQVARRHRARDEALAREVARRGSMAAVQRRQPTPTCCAAVEHTA